MMQIVYFSDLFSKINHIFSNINHLFSNYHYYLPLPFNINSLTLQKLGPTLDSNQLIVTYNFDSWVKIRILGREISY